MSSDATVASSLPHWDVSAYFPAVESSEFRDAVDALRIRVASLRERADILDIRRHDHPSASDAAVAAYDEITRELNGIGDDVRLLSSYLHAFISTDARNTAAQGAYSELDKLLVDLSTVWTRHTAWVGSFDSDALIARSTEASHHAFAVRKAAIAARHQMSEAEEDLSAHLTISGSSAWAKLHGNITSRLAVAVEFPEAVNDERAGTTRTLPMSAVRGLAHDADPHVRKAAYEAELRGWETVGVPLAAAMNGIKGEVVTLNARRGWPDALAPALFGNNVERETLSAMHEACVASFPDFRRYFRAKARLLGHAGPLPWCDLFAPLGQGARSWPYPEAEAFVIDRFADYSDRLAGVARRAMRERWVDAEPRDGKRDGAFCMSVRADESRVFMNFAHSFNSVQTLAHELGHAYHNINLADRTATQRATPMPLAETASIFCETLVTTAALDRAAGADRLTMLDAFLENASQIVVDIHSRFLLETRVFGQRAKRELSVEELNNLMLGAQRETYGDGLDTDQLHAFMWAMKPHYYSTRSFYNWPYTFGLLFGLGLYARYEQDAPPFRRSFDDLLAHTGMESAAQLGHRFGIDFGSVGFWKDSLDVCRARIDDFATAVDHEITRRS
ncbi:MAG: oligoendopeptidase F [Chloroflexi bacterium]|nr:oligoendopeptidase F [Chloroflexota bacterium]